ncbi:MAG: ABC transporter ATP-binding protein [Anaerolineae bacterium]
MGFIMGGLDREQYDREYGDWQLVRRILAYFRPQMGRMAVATAAIVLHSLFEAAVPILISLGIDAVIASPNVGNALLLGGAVFGLQALAWVFNYVRQTQSARAIGSVVVQLFHDAFTAVTEHDMSFYDEQPTGRIVSRITTDAYDFGSTAELVMNLASQLLAVFVIGVYIWRINVPLTLILLAMTPLVFALALGFRRLARQTSQNARRILAKVNANIQESVSGIAVAKGFRQEGTMYGEFAVLNEQTYKVNLVRGLTLNSIFPILNMTFSLAMAVMVNFGGRASLPGVPIIAGIVPAGAITVGEWYLFIQALGQFWFPMTSIASFWSQFQDGLAAAERVFALMDAESKVNQTDDIPAPKLSGRIEFQHVSLRYKEGESVLPDFSLRIEPGESVALVGHTGAGKTSIARLLVRFYEFQGGRILIDGLDIRTLNLASYRRQIGLVPQVPFLFSGTVLHNIRYGRPEATDAEVTRVAQQIGNGDWLLDLPNGLQTDVGERGAHLSMGQRQLVALARVLLQDPAVFILDEATASVDPFTETQIQDGLAVVMQGRTSLVIAHRLSTVRNADRILVLRDGRIIEEGTHRGLLAQGGHYAELYNTYFRHQSLDYIESANQLGT